jgi:tetratricopeptide (TPR) repeat protein
MATPVCDSREGYKKFYDEVDTLAGTLKDKRFHDLDARLNAALDDAQAGRITDDEAGRWFARLFQKQRIGDEPHRDWIAAYPKSRAALVAAAYDHMGRGFAARSPEFPDKASDAQSEAMRTEFEKAYPLLDQADSLGKPLSLSEALRLDMRTHARELSQVAFQPRMAHALSKFPQSTSLRLVWINKSTPKWGGSLEAVAAVEKSLGPLPPAEQRYMRYVIAEDTGDAFELAGQYDAAGRLYDQAIPLCPGFWSALQSAMRAYQKAKNHDALIKDSNVYLARYPKASWGLVKRGWAYSQKGNYVASRHDYEIAASLGYAPGFSGLAWFFETGQGVKQDYAHAIDLYQEAVDHGEAKSRDDVERVKKKTAEQHK